MIGKFLRITATFFEDLRVRSDGTFRVSYEAYWINVAQLFQYCDKGGLGSGMHRIFPSGLDILA